MGSGILFGHMRRSSRRNELFDIQCLLGLQSKRVHQELRFLLRFQITQLWPEKIPQKVETIDSLIIRSFAGWSLCACVYCRHERGHLMDLR